MKLDREKLEFAKARACMSQKDLEKDKLFRCVSLSFCRALGEGAPLRGKATPTVQRRFTHRKK